MTYHVSMICNNCGNKLRLEVLANNAIDAAKIVEMIICDDCWQLPSSKNPTIIPTGWHWLAERDNHVNN